MTGVVSEVKIYDLVLPFLSIYFQSHDAFSLDGLVYAIIAALQ